MLTQLTTALTDIITNLYVATGLFGIILAMAIESCCIPLPSEVVMPIAGILIAQGKLLPGMNPFLAIFLVALSGAFGCLLGSIVAYYIGYKGGRPLMLKYGRYVLISQHDADKADAFFARWGTPTAFFSRLLPVVRTYISLPAGIAKMPFLKFCVYSFLGSLPWCFLLAYAGTVLGDHMDVLSPIFHVADVFIAIALVILVVWYVRRHLRHDREAREAHAAAEALQQSASAQQAIAQGINQAPWNQAQPQSSAQQWNQAQAQQWGQQPPYPQQPPQR
ncbi:DedA family protein [Tengunoibacter tsumagoiensis]|uniref:VTT domain-containing protein n=1 Tax=Tengunoibacter tsumagoiensis TaxID=2014871 RepID=A0A401ZY89_9CHLR|nr:DedA family protein [Tengunoibacter tsumagoiensis]GCE11800.1 hypothetical protein KTT_16590 [Tengunoibacter tsumagoiensis]